jgi:trigger factor
MKMVTLLIKSKRGMIMRKFNKGCAVVLALALSMSFMTGCGDSNGTSGKLDNTASKATSSDATESADNTSEEFASIEDMIDQYAADVTLGEYKGMEYEAKNTDVTDDEVQAKVDSFVSGLATYDKDTTSVAKSGDTVNIDFVGTVDGEEFEGGNTNGSGYDLLLGSGSFIDNFEDQIIGHKPGETFTVDVTFPENYSQDKTELNGKAAKFETTLNYIKVNKPATYNDELVANNTSYKTTAEYEAAVREQLKQDKEDSALASAQNEVMVAVINNTTIENISAEDVQANADNIISSIKAQAESNGMEYETYLYYYYRYDDVDTFEQYVQQVCEESQKERMVVCAIAKKENISITDDEADKYLSNYAKKNSVDESALRQNLTDIEIKYNALAEKVMNFLMDNAKATTGATTEAAETTESTEAADAEQAEE